MVAVTPQLTAVIMAVSALTVLVGTFYAVRWHRRNLSRPRVGYGFSKPEIVGVDPDSGVDEAYELELVLRNQCQDSITAEKFGGKPMVIFLNAPVLGISRVRSWPVEQARPRDIHKNGTRLLIGPFGLSHQQEVRVTIRTAEAPRDMRVEVSAPEVTVVPRRWRKR